MAELLVVVDSEAKAQFMKEYFRDRADCLVCEGPLFKTSHQISSGAPSGLLFQFDGLPAAQHCLDALHDFQDKEILLALDENALANYLCWQISSYVAQRGGRQGAVKRLTVKAFSKENMDAAQRLAWPVDAKLGPSFYNHKLFDDCLAHHLVRLVGTDRGPGNLPLRKNSLTTLFLLAEREQERSMFPLVPKWQVQAKLATATKDTITVYLTKGMDLAADGLIVNEAKARIVRDLFWQTTFRVDAKNRLPLMITAPEPYQLAELLHDAMVLLDLYPTTTMDMVRKLFHGVPVGDRIGGLITSPVRHQRGVDRAPVPGAEIIGQEMVADLRRQVATLYGEAALDDRPRPTLGMIIPVSAELSGADLAQVLSQDEIALYDLIRMRAFASQMRPAVGYTVTIDFLAGKENIFQAHFHELDDPGFLQTTPLQMAHLQTSIPAAGIKDGQEFRPIKVECESIVNEGQGAERYTIETLLAALADFSVAPDMSTINMLDSMIKAGYATISKQGRLKTEENASKVVTILDRAFPRMQGINLAAYIEQTITEAASSRKDLPFALKQFDQTLMLHGKTLVKAKVTTAKVQPRTRTSSTIIKQAAPTVEAILSIPPKESGAFGPINEGLPLAESPREVSPQIPVTAGPDQSQEPIAPESSASDTWAESPSGGDWTESLPEESARPAEMMEEDKASHPAELGANPPAEETQADAWPDDLQKIFADALTGVSATADAAETATSPAAAVPPTEQSRPCPACGKSLLLREDHFGAFWKCSGFPGCRYSEATNQADASLVCPLCGHGLTRKQTPTGKSFYVCGHQECQFMSWSIPHYLPCGLCDSPYLVEKTVRGIPQLRCPRAGCTYGQPLPEENLETIPPPIAPAAVPTTKKFLVRRVAPGSSTGGGTKKVRIVRRRT